MISPQKNILFFVFFFHWIILYVITLQAGRKEEKKDDLQHYPWALIDDVMCKLMCFSLWVTDKVLMSHFLKRLWRTGRDYEEKSMTDNKLTGRSCKCRKCRVVSFIVKGIRKVRWCMGCPLSAFVIAGSSCRGQPFIPARMRPLWTAFMLRVFSSRGR